MANDMVSLILTTAKGLVEEDELELESELDADTTLFGSDGVLDSMALVSLVVAVEQAIEQEYGATVSLADEKALSQKNSPYRSVRSLAEYAEQLL